MAHPQPPKKANTAAIVGFVGAVVVSAVAVVLALVLTNNDGDGGGGNNSGSSGGSTSTPTEKASDKPADPVPVMQVVVDAINSENPEGVDEIACDDTAAATMRGYIDSLTQVHPTAKVVGTQPVDKDTIRGTIGYSYVDPTDRTIEKVLVLQMHNADNEVCGQSLAEQE